MTAKRSGAARPAAAPADQLAGMTQPRPTNAQGRQLDEHGLPINGPARRRALEARGRTDPAAEPAAPAVGETTTEE